MLKVYFLTVSKFDKNSLNWTFLPENKVLPLKFLNEIFLQTFALRILKLKESYLELSSAPKCRILESGIKFSILR